VGNVYRFLAVVDAAGAILSIERCAKGRQREASNW
jgi:hypothetical protein